MKSKNEWKIVIISNTHSAIFHIHKDLFMTRVNHENYVGYFCCLCKKIVPDKIIFQISLLNKIPVQFSIRYSGISIFIEDIEFEYALIAIYNDFSYYLTIYQPGFALVKRIENLLNKNNFFIKTTHFYNIPPSP